jgi:hypothetical protein
MLSKVFVVAYIPQAVYEGSTSSPTFVVGGVLDDSHANRS